MKNKSLYILLLCCAIISTLVIIFYNGTGDAGDSIHHYLFAKYAPQHPELYFDHWAKPIFTLLASPFAQFGFTGIKVFNALVALTSVFFTYKTIQALKVPQPLVGSIILICIPLWFVLTYSGLTEPLFALFTITGVYLTIKNKYITACILISFLPFVRTEGLIILGIFGLYYLFRKKWILLPYLLTGNIFYAIIGYFYFKDFLWVFTQNPYAKMSSTYGSGELFYFVEQLYYVVGIPIYILFWVGVIVSLWKILQKNLKMDYSLLIFSSFFFFFIAHTLFWYWGIFNSMGLKRVLISVAPLISIIALLGFNFINLELLQQFPRGQKIAKVTLLLIIVVFPFTSNPAAIDWESEMSLNQDQKTAHKVVTYIHQNYNKNRCFYYAHPYLSEALNIDHFDPEQRKNLDHTSIQSIKSGDIIIWENWFAPIEYGVSQTDLKSHHDFIPIFDSKTKDDGREIEYIVFLKK